MWRRAFIKMNSSSTCITHIPLVLTTCLCLTFALTLPSIKISSDKNLKAEFTDILRQTFSKHRRDSNGYTEHIMSYGGVVGLQRVAIDKDTSLGLREITNGSIIVQLIFSPKDTLSDCDVSNSKRDIQKLLKHVTSKKDKLDRYFTRDILGEIEQLMDFTDMDVWISKCNKYHMLDLGINAPPQRPGSYQLASVPIPAQPMQGTIISHMNSDNRGSRERRGVMDLIYPGTKWCGKGNSARHYYDLGEMKHTDRCCRQHDMCSDIIPALSVGYNYFNYGLLTISSCSCDNRLKRCLRQAAEKHNDDIADMIGHLYFNVIGMTCFNIQEKDYCVETSWWGRCLKSERQPAACFDEMLRY